MKKILIFVFSFLMSIPFAQGQQGQESITITTYYHAPFGIYRELQVINNRGANVIIGEDPNHPGNPIVRLIDTDPNGGLDPLVTFQDHVGNNPDASIGLEGTRFTIRSNTDGVDVNAQSDVNVSSGTGGVTINSNNHDTSIDAGNNGNIRLRGRYIYFCR